MKAFREHQKALRIARRIARDNAEVNISSLMAGLEQARSDASI